MRNYDPIYQDRVIELDEYQQLYSQFKDRLAKFNWDWKLSKGKAFKDSREELETLINLRDYLVGNGITKAEKDWNETEERYSTDL